MKCKFTYECSACGNPCQISGDHVGAPGRCPYNAAKADWREVHEPVALPKLTTEELARLGIEWPEWAKCAAVDLDGCAYFYSEVPITFKYYNDWKFGKRFCEIPGKWDASDWQNSKIMRPEKVEQAPDWLKIGAWAAVGNFVGKIDWISRDASECRITCGESRFAKNGEAKAVTWRAWTRSEWCEQIGNRFQFNNGVRMLLSVIECDGKFEVEFLGGSYCENDDILNENIKQLNGLPCGVPQCEGKDLEG